MKQGFLVFIIIIAIVSSCKKKDDQVSQCATAIKTSADFDIIETTLGNRCGGQPYELDYKTDTTFGGVDAFLQNIPPIALNGILVIVFTTLAPYR